MDRLVMVRLARRRKVLVAHATTQDCITGPNPMIPDCGLICRKKATMVCFWL